MSLVEIMIVVAIVAAITAIAIPNYLKTGKKSTKVICINNLKQIDSAIGQWALDNDVRDGVVPSEAQEEVIYNYIKGGKPECPSKGVYSINALGSDPQVECSYAESEGHKLQD